MNVVILLVETSFTGRELDQIMNNFGIKILKIAIFVISLAYLVRLMHTMTEDVI